MEPQQAWEGHSSSPSSPSSKLGAGSVWTHCSETTGPASPSCLLPSQETSEFPASQDIQIFLHSRSDFTSFV